MKTSSSFSLNLHVAFLLCFCTGLAGLRTDTAFFFVLLGRQAY